MSVTRCATCGAVSTSDSSTTCRRCRRALVAGDGPQQVDAAALVAAIVSSPAPVVVDFRAGSASVVDAATRSAHRDLVYLRVDTRREPAAAAAYHVGAAPTLVMFHGGHEVARLCAPRADAVPAWISAAAPR